MEVLYQLSYRGTANPALGGHANITKSAGSVKLRGAL
jgi:hypothetical protein